MITPVRKNIRFFEKGVRSLFEKSSAKAFSTPTPTGIGVEKTLSVSFGNSPCSIFQKVRTSSHP